MCFSNFGKNFKKKNSHELAHELSDAKLEMKKSTIHHNFRM